ncbi:HNH endonuclease [Gordonia phage Walrus]|uniref:HNH endonuclease n=1 Tax=Gordonia phage Walrus TaxID=2517927 RepID=A0A481S1Q3_9CAUD|nr:endonuclease [Gordonia phage Walrus]QBG78459.1 HNH endonuclease [Gordonia phage Walrus]
MTRFCVHCAGAIVRRPREAHTVYARRRFCSRTCNGRHNAANMRDHSTPLELIERIGWDVTETGCWEWRGRRTSSGYGESPVRVGDIKTGEIFAHRLAYIAWNGPIPDGLLVRHQCDNPPCINPDHLLVGTHSDNTHDAVSRERHAHGESHGGAKLTETDVRELRAAHRSGSTYRELAARYGLNRYTVGRIVRGERWASVPLATFGEEVRSG